MVQMVDSDDKMLNSQQIIQIALDNTNSNYPPEVAYPAILAEVSGPRSMVFQYGNTIFSVIKGKGRIGFFKAFNADTARNFVENSKMFVRWAYETGLDGLVTQFDDVAILKVFKAIAKNPPMKDMGYKAYKTQQGGYKIVLQLGKPRGDEE